MINYGKYVSRGNNSIMHAFYEYDIQNYQNE